MITMVTREDFAKQLADGYERRIFIVGHVTDYIAHLNEMEAFALSRLMPKAITDKVIVDRKAAAFVDKLLDYHIKISANGPIRELKATKEAEEMFLSVKGTEMLNALLNR